MSVKRVINTEFWTDSKVVNEFSPEDKFFMLYLLTNPRTTQLGIYEFNARIAAFEMGYSLDTVYIMLDRFETKYNILKYSKETQEVAIKNYLRHSIVKGGKPVFDCLCSEAKSVKNKSLIKYVWENIKKQENLNATVLEFFYSLFGQNARQADNSHDVSDNVSFSNRTRYGGNDNDNDNDNDNIKTSCAFSGEKVRDGVQGDALDDEGGVFAVPKNDTQDKSENDMQDKKYLQEQRFSEFWNAYPRKVGKEAARKAWKKVHPDSVLFDKIIKAIAEAKKSEQWKKQNGQFIPHPATWLNQGRWDDEIDTSPVTAAASPQQPWQNNRVTQKFKPEGRDLNFLVI